MTQPPKKDPVSAQFEEHMYEFTSSLEGLITSLPMVSISLVAEMQGAIRKRDDFIDKNATENNVIGNGRRQIRLKAKDTIEFNKLNGEVRKRVKSTELIHRGYLVSIISLYDAFLGRIIAHSFNSNAETINSSEKTFSIKEIMSFNTLDDAKTATVNRIVDSVIRDSHENQIEFIQKTFGVEIKNKIDQLNDFIEITQRRHLFVHCDGIISQQYASQCKNLNGKFCIEKRIGEQLRSPVDYLDYAFETVYVTGLIIGISLWIKTKTHYKEDANQFINRISLSLIENERYQLAINILDRVLSLDKGQTYGFIRMAQIINLAQAYKWSGDEKKCNEILSKNDWSAHKSYIQMSCHVLMDQFDEAIKLMESSRNEEFEPLYYSSWPLFKEFIKRSDFKAKYRELYGEAFSESIIQSEVPSTEVNSGTGCTDDTTRGN